MYQLLVVVVALVGGIWPALFAAVLSGLTLDYFFIDPVHTITIADPLHLLALILYTVIAALVSFGIGCAVLLVGSVLLPAGRRGAAHDLPQSKLGQHVTPPA